MLSPFTTAAAWEVRARVGEGIESLKNLLSRNRAEELPLLASNQGVKNSIIFCQQPGLTRPTHYMTLSRLCPFTSSSILVEMTTNDGCKIRSGEEEVLFPSQAAGDLAKDKLQWGKIFYSPQNPSLSKNSEAKNWPPQQIDAEALKWHL